MKREVSREKEKKKNYSIESLVFFFHPSLIPCVCRHHLPFSFSFSHFFFFIPFLLFSRLSFFEFCVGCLLSQTFALLDCHSSISPFRQNNQNERKVNVERQGTREREKAEKLLPTRLTPSIRHFARPVAFYLLTFFKIHK